jgi:hypothetical protein
MLMGRLRCANLMKNAERAGSKPPQVSFTASERDLIRGEMGMHFGQYPSLTARLLASCR